ncbi:MAG: hypothetical protein LBP28_05725 [Coriobacteriales bacterium]|jgi:hypothetical protein|nr:hypothetical protein [Coriobacteriales bacterium]
MTGWQNPLLTAAELAKLTGIDAKWLRSNLDTVAKDGIPTFRRAQRPQVLYSDFLDWYRDHYGPGGDTRGCENLDIGRLQ